MRRDRDLEAAERRIKEERDLALQAAAGRRAAALRTANEKLRYTVGIAREIQQGEMQAANDERQKRHGRAHDDYRHAEVWAHEVWRDGKKAADEAYELECVQAERKRDDDAAAARNAYTSMSDQEGCAPEGAMTGPSEDDVFWPRRVHAARQECLGSIFGAFRQGEFSERVAQAFDAYDLTKLELIHQARFGEGVDEGNG